MAAPKTFLERIESLIKFAGAALTVVVIFGYPAIYVQLRNYDLPLQVVGYRSIFNAGIIPALIFTAFFVFGYLVYQKFRKDKTMDAIILIVLVVAPVFLIEYLAALVMFMYGYFWVFARVLFLLGLEVTNVQLLDFTLIALGTILLGVTIWNLFPGVRRFYKKSRERIKGVFGKKRVLPEEEASEPKSPEVLAPTPVVNSTTEESPATRRIGTKNKDWGMVFFGLLLFAAIPYLGYESLVWIFETRFPGLPEIKLLKPVLFNASITLSIVLAILIPISFIKNQLLGIRLFFGAYALAFIVLVYFYSVHWHKQLDIRLGGGKPTPVSIWVKTDDFPREILSIYNTKQLSDTSKTDSSKYTHWVKGSLLMDNDKHVVIANRDSTWVIIPRDKIVVMQRVTDKN